MKKRVLAWILCGLTAAAMAGCGKVETSTGSKSKSVAASGSEAANEKKDADTKKGADTKKASDIQVSVVLHALNGSFYTKMQEGAKQAGEDLGIKVNVSAPNTASSLQEQVSLLETAIASGSDAIATVTWDPTGFNNVIAEAADKGIPVVGFNMDAEGCGTAAFIGQDYETAGYDLGKYVFDKMGGEGTYIIASCGPTDTALVAREAGVDKAAGEYGDKVKKIETIDIGTDLTNAYSVIENAYLANPDVKAIIGVDVYSEAIGSVIEDYDLSGKVYTGGFDLTEGMLNHIKKGSVQVTCGQNPYMQGYYSVLECYMNQAHGCNFLDINTGAQLVDASNVDTVEAE